MNFIYRVTFHHDIIEINVYTLEDQFIKCHKCSDFIEMERFMRENEEITLNQCVHLQKVDWCRFSDMHLDFDCTKSPCESYEKRSKPK